MVGGFAADHSICGAVVLEHEEDPLLRVKHMCCWEIGHLGSHECTCGKYWLNAGSPHWSH